MKNSQNLVKKARSKTMNGLLFNFNEKHLNFTEMRKKILKSIILIFSEGKEQKRYPFKNL